MTTEDGKTSDEQEIANSFNTFFTEKITKLKDKIDKDIIVDPLEKLKEKMSTKQLKFEIKTITKEVVNNALKKMKKKKSSGSDGLSQQHLAMGSNELALPLMTIFNKSINTGEFPSAWKEAIVTPVLKKGNKELYENYRPISCLPAAAKLLESIVCDQVSV